MIAKLRPAAGDDRIPQQPEAQRPIEPDLRKKRTGFVVVRLGEAALTEEADRAETLEALAATVKLESLGQVLEALDVGESRRLITAVPPERLRGMEERARQSPFPPLRSLLAYWLVDMRRRPDAIDEAIDRLRATPGVDDAYHHLAGDDPATNPGNDTFNAQQGYQDAAPDGIDARWAWPQMGVFGHNVGVCDVEQGWRLAHEDLVPSGPTLIFNDNNPGSFNHGCAVLGEMVGADNAVGIAGIASAANPVLCSSHFDAGLGVNGFVSDAVVAGIDQLAPGDVMLIEVQTAFRPAETVDDTFDAIRLASALGIVVCAAAGNGGADLDTFTNASGQQILNPASADFRDSGAILVGACLSPLPHDRKAASNFGNRVDCFAWGEDVVTTGYGDLDNGGGDPDRQYAGDFQNTSAATPIVAGAALMLQSMHAATTGTRLSPMQMRGILSNPLTGTAQGGGVAGSIGVMPDLRAILDGNLGLAADVYLRDSVGDVGSVPTAGAISASPDIIVRPVQVPDPTAAFGEGSGTENSATLGFEVEAGQDNFLYVRAKNRGGTAAAGVTAQLFWSPVATLVAPALWTPIGTTASVDVPAGDTLVVTDALVWPAAAIPASGHYCFVGILDHPADLAPVLPSPTDFDGFRAFIRNQNNVTWRNFNVIDDIEDPAADPSAQDFLIANFPKERRFFDFVVDRRLVPEVQVTLELPAAIAKPFVEGLQIDWELDDTRQRALIPLPAAPRLVAQRVLLPADARLDCRIIFTGLSRHGKPGQSLAIAQVYEDEEVGRVTWAFERKREPRIG
ncbi:MAG: S8 family serine peptidase [Acidimicrobiales bacterium]